MSGIAGIYHLDGRRPVERESLRQMTAAMAHRGPDGAGHWIEGPIGLGHRALHTTPESLHERLPMTDETGSLCLTLDGRVDNRDELRAALAGKGFTLRGDTDAELVLRAYQCWGTESPKHIVGDFAYAVWDQRIRTLFCARDCVGVRPFVYHLSHRLFAFASDINALLRGPDVPCEVNELRVAEFLVPYLEGSDKTITFYKGILRLPPACVLIVSPERVVLEKYWALDPSREVTCGSDAEYVEAFREVFTEAVRCRLRANGPVASMLSGGLDSSSIVGVARKVLAEEGARRRLVTISAVSENEEQCVEAPYINAILAQGGLDALKIHPTDVPSFGDEFERMIHRTDDPFIVYSAGIPWLASAVARRHGIRVLFSGVDGDLVASSNDFDLIDLLRTGRLVAFAREARARVRYYRPYYQAQRYPRARAMWQYGIRPLISAYVLSPHTKVFRRLSRAHDRLWTRLLEGSPIDGAFARRIAVEARLAVQDQLGPLGTLSARKVHCNSLQAPFLAAAVERYDRVAASQSVELRHPLLDRRMIELCAALPPAQMWGQGWTKLILRRALEGILPDEVCWRGFSPTSLMPEFGSELFGALGRHLARLAAQDWCSIAGYANLSRMEQAVERYRGDARTGEQGMLWQAVALALWLERTRCGNAREPFGLHHRVAARSTSLIPA